MVRILVLKRLYNLSDEQMEYRLLDRMSYKRFCGLRAQTNIRSHDGLDVREPYRRSRREGAVRWRPAQLLKKGFIARGGQIIDATLVPAPSNTPAGRESFDRARAMPAGWKPAKRRQKTRPGTKKHGKSTFRHKPRSTSTRNTSSSARSRPTRRARTIASTSTTCSTPPTRAGTSMPTGGYPSEEREAWLKERAESDPAQQAARFEWQQRRKSASPGRARGSSTCSGPSSRWQVDPHHRPDAGELPR